VCWTAHSQLHIANASWLADISMAHALIQDEDQAKQVVEPGNSVQLLASAHTAHYHYLKGMLRAESGHIHNAKI